MSIDDDPATQVETEEQIITPVSLVTPGTHSAEVDQFNQIIQESLQLPMAVGAQTCNTEPININNIEGVNSSEVNRTFLKGHIYRSPGITIVSETYLRYTKGVKFDGDMVFVRKQDGSYGILQPDLSHINSNEEEARYFVYEEGPDGNQRKKIYRYRDGTPILERIGDNRLEIPIYRSPKLEYALKLSGGSREISKMQEHFKRYLENPERISYDGHSIQKHSFDSILALELLVENELATSSFYKIEQGQRTHSEGLKSLKYNFVLSTNEFITLPGQYEPEKLVHTEIAREMANTLKERIGNTQSNKELRRIGANLRMWIKEFSKSQPMLGVVLYNEIKYLLKYDYNLEYEVKKNYNTEDIENTVLPELSEAGIKEIVGEGHVPKDVTNKIGEIFRYEKARKSSSYLGDLLTFESKVDELLEYLGTKGIDNSTLEYLRLAGGFDRVVKPKVVLKGVQSRDGKILPTTSITTSYIKEYFSNKFVGNFDKYSISRTKQDIILGSARNGRDILDELCILKKDVSGVKNIHFLEGRWVDRIAEQLPEALNIDKDVIERFALDR